MRIIDKYILGSVVGVFLLCLSTFMLLYVVVDALSHLEDILKNHVPLAVLAEYYFSYLPLIFSRVSAFACLLATIYTFGKFTKDNEMIALRASGLDIYQITRPVLIFGVLISLLVLRINSEMVPAWMIRNQAAKQRIENSPDRNAKTKREAITNLSVYGMRNRLFFINRFYPATNTLEGINILEQDEHQNVTRKIVANKGVYREGFWTFYQVITYDFWPNGQIKQEPGYEEEETMAIPEKPDDFLNQRQQPEMMTLQQLDDYIWKLSRSGATGIVRNLQVDFYQRLTEPFACVLIILLAVPFSLQMKKRAGGLSAIGTAIIMGFLYYVAGALSVAMGKAGLLPPLLSASLNHLIALGLSIYLIKKLP